MQWQNRFFGLSKAAAFGWAQALSTAANAATASKPSVPRDALFLKVRSVPSDGKYLDTIRQSRLALLSERAAPFCHFYSKVV